MTTEREKNTEFFNSCQTKKVTVTDEIKDYIENHITHPDFKWVFDKMTPGYAYTMVCEAVDSKFEIVEINGMASEEEDCHDEYIHWLSAYVYITGQYIPMQKAVDIAKNETDIMAYHVRGNGSYAMRVILDDTLTPYGFRVHWVERQDGSFYKDWTQVEYRGKVIAQFKREQSGNRKAADFIADLFGIDYKEPVYES